MEVYIEGQLLVTKGKTYTLDTKKITDCDAFLTGAYDKIVEDATDFVVPIWGTDGTPLFNIERIPSTEANTDIGTLKGIIMSRGYFVSNYTDVPVRPTKPIAENFATDAEFQAAMAQYTTDLSQYVKDFRLFREN